MSSPANYAFASDNTAGICPEAMRALGEANKDRVASYGDDPWTARAKKRFCEVFETECDVFFVFNGTASNALALSALCRSYQSIFCHDSAHVDVDECGAPEFFGGGCKVLPLSGPDGKLDPAELERAMHRGHGVHFPKPGAVSITQSTEWGTLYSPDEVKALAAVAKAHGMSVHMDGARFANAAAALQKRNLSPADLTWRAGVDVLSFGGTKNGMHTTEAVVFFNRALARDFEYRVKQGGQLASKMRFSSAQWDAVLADGAWLRHGAHANAQAKRLGEALRKRAGLRLIGEPVVNAVFVELPLAAYEILERGGWRFYRFIGENGYRLMCSWSTTDQEIDAFVSDVVAAVGTTKPKARKARR